MKDSLIEQLRAVKDSPSLIIFIKRLREDLKENLEEWENRDLASYLEAMSAWIEVMDVAYKNMNMVMPDTPDWRMIAQILIAPKVYE